MVTPFLRGPAGLGRARLPAPRPAARRSSETCGVVVFHEQVLEIIDDADRLHAWPRPTRPGGRSATPTASPRSRPGSSRRRCAGATTSTTVERVWEVLKAFASFGFCKAHAAAFALPTYQSAWLKAHHPAAFLAGVLTHDPGMYPKRLILDDARQFGIAVLPLDVNASDDAYRVERVAGSTSRRPAILGGPPRRRPDCRLPTAALRHPAVAGRRQGHQRRRGRPDRRRPALRLALRLLAPRRGVPPGRRAAGARRRRSTPSTASAAPVPVRRRGQVTRRDLLLQVAELDRWTAGDRPAPPRAVSGHSRARAASRSPPSAGRRGVRERAAAAVAGGALRSAPVRRPARPRPRRRPGPRRGSTAGLPEMTGAERVRAELEVLGLDASRHVVDFYDPFLDALRRHPLPRPAAPPQPLRGARRRGQGRHPDPADPLRPPGRLPHPRRRHRPARRHVLRGRAGPATPRRVFHSWLLVVRGSCGAPARAGISMRATGCWELPRCTTPGSRAARPRSRS